jgi:2-polyprenyl-3-methyl-5-hydroxy-6-metoxy-1,4-benzoquinol methylase
MNFTSPLTGKECNTVISKLSVKDIEKVYQKKMKVSIKDEFAEDSIYLVREEDIDFKFFYPFKAGSEKFYRDLYSNWPYEVLKNEYNFTKNYIGKDDKVLDAGCGDGQFAQFIESKNFCGLELNDDSIARAKDKGLTIHKETIQNFAKENKEKFDLVTSFQVLEHVDNPYEFIKSSLLCLKPNGLLVLSVPNNDSYKFNEVNSFSNIPPHHISRWNLKTFLWVAKEFNLELIDYNFDKETLRNYIRFTIVQNILNIFTGSRKNLISMNIFSRFFNFCLNGFLYLLKPILKTNVPTITGHSVTVVLKKRA